MKAYEDTAPLGTFDNGDDFLACKSGKSWQQFNQTKANGGCLSNDSPWAKVNLTGYDGCPAPVTNRIYVGATGEYTACGASDIPLTIPEATQFWDGMLDPPGSLWDYGVFFTEGNVWDRDFLDSDLTPLGIDNQWFDTSPYAISFYAGHGRCNAFPGVVQACTNNSQCTSPPAGTTLPGFCQDFPGGNRCSYRATKSADTCGNDDRFGHRAIYSEATSNARWGETVAGGGWAGAGTNGGTNMVILDTSCPVDPGHHIRQTKDAFAGIHILATLIHFTGDTLDVVDRGPALAARATQNPDGSAAQAWLETLLDVPVGAQNCAWGGGGRGMSGCGAHYISSQAESIADALFHVETESWRDLRTDRFDAKFNSGWAWRALCNFDCDTQVTNWTY